MNRKNYIGLRDPYLNVFYAYGGKAHLENNITKAFVNVLESLNDNQLKRVVNDLFHFELKDGNYKISFFLQKKPSEELVEKYPNRVMFAFSPTGKSWGIEGLDTKNKHEIRKALEKVAKEQSQFEEEQNEFIESTLTEIIHIRENKGSIPDGWLFIDVDNVPTLVVAMENKLYDLDPYQLNNHIEKSLLITENKPEPVYRKYEDILVLFKQLNTFLCDQFIEYLIILNYSQVDDFCMACLADESIRSRLLMNFGKDILEIAHPGEKDFRNYQTVRCRVNYPYLHEINLSFKDEKIELWLSFGSTQQTAKWMLSSIDRIDIHDSHFSHTYQGFHLLYYRGRIIKGSYVDKWDIDEFINYWKKNIDLVKTSTPKEAISLYQKMYDEGKIKKDHLDYIQGRLSNKKNPILIIPEISIVFAWEYQEASQLGLEAISKQIKDKIHIALKEMKLCEN